MASYTHNRTPSVNKTNFIESKSLLPDRCQITVEVNDPYIALIDNFLTDDECNTLIDMSHDRFVRSQVATENGEAISDYRTSHGFFMVRGETPLIDIIEKRIETVTLWPTLMSEGFNVLRYENGGEFKRHHDFFPADHADMANDEIGGNRVGTVILYLNDVHGEGETEFTQLGLKVYPRRGSLLIFSYPKIDFTCKSEHSGTAVHDQVKYVAVKWFRERPCFGDNTYND